MEGSGRALRIESDFLTLIPSRFPPINLFERICGGCSAEDLGHIESLTNPRLRERDRITGTVVADPQSPKLQNWNHAPFTYTNPEDSTCFPAEVPVLELSDDLQTALAVAVAKRERFLRRTRESAMGIDMRVIVRPVTGYFLDARGIDDGRRRLASSDALNRRLDGVVFRPPERPSAERIAILTGDVLGRAVQGEHFRFVWDGSRIKEIYSFNDEGRIIRPDQLPLAEPIMLG